MAGHNDAAPVIIKKKKVVAGDGHHGGAWKVAYADFVTAMMAFFMLMWLLNATTEKQRKGIADYFNPNVPINRISGGGDALFGGKSVFEDSTLAKNGTGGLPPVTMAPRTKADVGAHRVANEESGPSDKAFGMIEDFLIGNGGESLVTDNLMKHVITRQTDEGLVIEVFDLDEMPLFVDGEARAFPILVDLMRMIAGAVNLVANEVAVEGHVRAGPLPLAQPKSWEISVDRADSVRRLLEAHGLDASRIDRVTGHADRDPADLTPMSVRNNRIEIILLRD
ncbi:flagellar motor protein MotB [Shimia biformata]|uniref:flagellar motor protein MotB n=1 Tax=Shimia biformata TaxID=1294299 RepID=UPI0019525F28|nr:flagellar motor protein MotB [Shimia biformata]